MSTLGYVLGSVVLAMALFLIVAVLLQSGKDTQLSGTITGGAETFFGKTKGKTIDRVLSKLTAVIAVLFALSVLAMFLFI